MGQGLCLFCRDGGLLPIQHCTDMGHYQDTEQSDPSLQGHRAVPSLHCQHRRHCQPRTARYKGTTHPALQGCRSPVHHPSHTAYRALACLCAPGRKSRTQTHCPTCAAVQTDPMSRPCMSPRSSPSTLQWQAQHLPSAAQSLGNPTPCASKYCSLPSLQTQFLSIPSHYRLGHCTHALGAHPAPQGQPRVVPMSMPPAAEAVTAVLPPCIAETHTAHAAPQAPSHWKPPPSIHTLQRQ